VIKNEIIKIKFLYFFNFSFLKQKICYDVFMTKSSFKISFGFGIASGVITTLGLMIGLYSSTYSKGVVLGGILTIAIADAFSDAAGIHFYEETKGIHTTKEIWKATIFTFFSKFLVAISFLFPILFFSLKTGLILNIVWGFLLLSGFSFVVAKKQNNNPYKSVLEHGLIMWSVIIITYYVGQFIDRMFLK
jgi:vacuolar iron transporter family protein